MVTSTVILSLLSTVIGYGFPSGNGFEPGAIHVGLSPASAIPNITMSRNCVRLKHLGLALRPRVTHAGLADGEA